MLHTPFMRTRTFLRSLPALTLAVVSLSLPSAVADTPKRASGVLQPFVDRQELAGAVTLVATKDKVLELSAVGYSDVAEKTPLKTDAVFWIASMSKPITAAVVMMLVDEGKISLDDPVEKYLPEFKGQQLAIMKGGKQVGLKAPKHPITVRNVLSHTSGLPFKSPQEAPTLDALPLKDAVKTYAEMALQFEPNTAYQYSNAGINTAARILEVVSGLTYEDFMDQRLFTPLGMTDTTFWPNEAQVARLARAYQPNGGKNALEETTISQLQYPLTERTTRFPMPAGGLFSTARDVLRFCQMVANGGEFDGRRYLSEQAVKTMTSRQTAMSIKQPYGLGWTTGESFGHNGAMATNMTVHPKVGLITVFLVQHVGFPGNGASSRREFEKAALASFGKAQQ